MQTLLRNGVQSETVCRIGCRLKRNGNMLPGTESKTTSTHGETNGKTRRRCSVRLQPLAWVHILTAPINGACKISLATPGSGPPRKLQPIRVAVRQFPRAFRIGSRY